MSLFSSIIRKDRRRKKEEHLQRHLQQQHLANINQAVEIPSNSMDLVVPTNNNTNWYLKEKPNEEFRSPTTLTRAAGDEPFIVGTSIVRYSRELDRSSSYNYRPSTAEKYVGYQRNLPLQSLSRTEAPNEAETRMVRLGMIPPRPMSANGHIPVGYYTEPGRGKSQKGKNTKKKSKEPEEIRNYKEGARSGVIPPRPTSANGHIPPGYYTEPGKNKSPKGKDGKKKSRELEDGGRYKGEVLVPVREVQLWPVENSSNQMPYPLPREDYGTDGATWYFGRSTDGQNLTSSRSESALYPPSAAENYPRHGYQNANGRIAAPSLQRDASPTAAKVMDDQFHAEQDPDKLKRVKRVGVPILPE